MNYYKGNVERLDNWEKLKLKDVCSRIFSGGTPNTNKIEYWNGSLPWLSSGETRNRLISKTENKITELGVTNSSTRLAKAGSSVIASAGQGHTRGQVSYLLIDTYINQSVIALFPRDEKLDSKFLFYSLNIKYERLRQISDDHSIRGSLTTKLLGEELIDVPPIQEQKAIAKILSDLDAKIELNQKMNKILEAISQAIFKHWFIDFEFPNENGKPYKSSGGEMVDSELGEIPKGWEVKRLGDVLNVVRGVSYKSSQLVPSKNALVTLKSILKGGGFTKNGFKPYSGDYKASQLVNAQDIIIAFTDLTQQGEVIGRPAMVEDTVEYKNMIASMDVGVIKSKENFQFKFFIYQLMKTESFHSHLLGYVNGTTVLHLSNEGPKSYIFSCPDMGHLIQFENLLLFFYNKIHYNTKQIEFLSLVRDLLLPKLISGKIRVPLEE